ncbi:ATP phosphoribosyltransferase [Persephonella sp. KM09-Lau-8]|uniref:ATP phosphoribosyltransferase n=1 Tax=Persephonella sp. KM09-Lau-8 TaxID=1158345 RepID=UPI0004975A8A|nr:ATP phosphoribosyltransferase [Persephonella sp. KM09-Lau-8]
MEKLTVALPKGRLFDQTIQIFKESDILKEEVQQNSRKLILETADFRFLLVRAKDVPTYVEYGVADLGVAGDDLLMEMKPDVYRPVDLGIGACTIMVAGLPQDREKYFSNPTSLKISTKYPNIAREFFGKKGIEVQIIELYGSIELAPLVGLSEFIVDIVETGRTLRENGLVVIEEIAPSSAKLIVNRATYKTKNQKVMDIIEKLENTLVKG